MFDNIESVDKSELIEYIKLLESELDNANNLIDKKNKELLNTKAKIISQDITLASYKDKVGIPLIVEGDERDIYDGEQKDFILDLIKDKMDISDKFSRSYKICESILNVNHKNGLREKIKSSISKLFKNFEGMSSDKISELNKLGISVSDCSKHYKLYYTNDDRYSVHVSHTTSNARRCGMNAASDIDRIMF